MNGKKDFARLQSPFLFDKYKNIIGEMKPSYPICYGPFSD